MLRDKLYEIQLKISELSDLLEISRPTLYKYIEDFENNNLNKIPSNIKRIFKIICSEKVQDKFYIFNYIMKINNQEKEKKYDEKQKFDLFLLSDEIPMGSKYKDAFLILLNNNDYHYIFDFIDLCEMGKKGLLASTISSQIAELVENMKKLSGLLLMKGDKI